MYIYIYIYIYQLASARPWRSWGLAAAGDFEGGPREYTLVSCCPRSWRDFPPDTTLLKMVTSTDSRQFLL